MQARPKGIRGTESFYYYPFYATNIVRLLYTNNFHFIILKRLYRYYNNYEVYIM
jgi:hypothetical protein